MAINPAVISGAFGLGSNILTNIGSKKRESDARFFNMQMERDRRNYDQRMWSKVTKYNHPLQQMARLAEAGLNPNLIYGSSPGSAVGNAQSIASGKQVTGQAPSYQIDNAMVPFMDAKVKQAQANNMNTQAMKNVADANLSTTQENRYKQLLGGELKIQDETVNQAKTKTYMDRLDSIAASLPGKGKIAEQMVKIDTAIHERDKVGLEKNVSQLRSDLAKRGIRETDPIGYRIMATILDIDLSKPLTKEQAEAIQDFMKDPWNKLVEYIERH
jgi:hypothetical protein